MGEIGEVIEVNGETVKVKLKRMEACAKCRVCTAGMASEDMFVDAVNVCNASVGQKVQIELEGDMFLKAVAIMYGVPCLSLVFGFVAGYYGALYLKLPYSEPIGFGFGIVCVLVAFVWIRHNEFRWKKQNFIPRAVEIQQDHHVAL